MPLTFSIATGLSLGVLSLTFVKLGSGKYREVSPLVWILAILFVLRYAFLGRNSLDYRLFARYGLLDKSTLRHEECCLPRAV